MSMHLEKPYLTTTGKKKGKQKFASAAHKQRAEQAATDWKLLQKKWGVEEDTRKQQRAMNSPPLSASYSLKVPDGRSTAHIKSLNTGDGVAVLKPVPQYTGQAMLGVSQMHKSNAVPVFRTEDIQDIARMRR